MSPYIGDIVEGVAIGLYSFDKFKQEKTNSSADIQLQIWVHPDQQAEAERQRQRSLWISENVNRCRDLINEPASIVTPAYLAASAQDIAQDCDLEVEVMEASQLAEQGYQGLLRVGQGSLHPPCMVVLRKRPRIPLASHLALIGKGITFDSGGISLKPGDHMWEMKGDMAGAAAVLLTMRALGRLHPQVNVTGILCCAENMPDAAAQRPGDILIAKNGKSIMVDNTDAEGRLILTDGLARAGEEGATHVVDIATLTGAVVRALGTSVAGALGTDRDLVRWIIDAGQSQGEAFWELPLVEEYRELLKSPFADINNIASGGSAGAITAALFLREFVPTKTKWAHLDIAGLIFKDKDWKYYDAGAVGFGVKTLVEFCGRFHELSAQEGH
jgi:leucyl aminopeptidase